MSNPGAHYYFSSIQTKIERTPDNREVTRVSREIDRLERRRSALLATCQFRYPSHHLPGYLDHGATRQRTLHLELALAAINGPQQPLHPPSAISNHPLIGHQRLPYVQQVLQNRLILLRLLLHLHYHPRRHHHYHHHLHLPA